MVQNQVMFDSIAELQSKVKELLWKNFLVWEIAWWRAALQKSAMFFRFHDISHSFHEQEKALQEQNKNLEEQVCNCLLLTWAQFLLLGFIGFAVMWADRGEAEG